MQKNEPFFIIGGQRSGTTLLRLMLNNHSEVSVPEEGTFWMPLLRREAKNPGSVFGEQAMKNAQQYLLTNGQFSLWKIEDDSLANAFSKLDKPTLKSMIDAVYGLVAERNGKSRWGDKTPSFFRMVPVLATMFPKARFVHIIRDGRDVYLSQRNMGIHSRNVSSAALEWKIKVDQARKDMQKYAPGRYVDLKFEDLLTETEKSLRQVSDFIGIPWEQGMLDYWKTSKDHIGEHHSKAIFEPVDPTQAGRWRTEMPKEEIIRFEKVTKSFLAFYGYPVGEFGSAGLMDSLSVGIELLSGIPQRALQVLRTRRELDRSAEQGLGTDASGCGSSGTGTD